MEKLPFALQETPWQNNPAHITHPEGWIAYQGGEACAYILFEQRKNADSELQLIIFQIGLCDDLDTRRFGTEIIEQWIRSNPADHYQTFNLIASPELCEVLERVGFEKQRGQVWMKREVKNRPLS